MPLDRFKMVVAHHKTKYEVFNEIRIDLKSLERKVNI